MDRMSGFRRAMPFTFGCFIVGGLALAGVPPFSGFFSKDEILLMVGDRGGWYWALYVAGYVGALMTAVYTFRMIFRTFFGDPCPEAQRARGRATSTTPRPRATRPAARSRTTTSASPVPSTTSPSARPT